MDPLPSLPTSFWEKLLLDHLSTIERIVAFYARRYHFVREEEEDFLSTIKVKLIENDYETLRNFRGGCKLEGFLAVVIHRQIQDYANHLWGKWRPSAEAKRLGETAQCLERLLYLKGHTLAEACEILEVQHKVRESREQIEALAAKLPQRVHRKMEGEEEIQNLPSPNRSDRLLWDRERLGRKRRVWESLEQALRKLPAQDWLILRMKSEGTSLQDIAKFLRIDAKQIYRRREKALKTLRQLMEENGVQAEDVAEILGRDDES
jgi:RNA polymerase sigma factor (sigma-70 family)